MKKPETVVQRQLDAYNAHDLEKFVAEYSQDIEVFRPPQSEPVLKGMQAFSEHYAKNRFTLPDLHANVVNRMVNGNIVVDHEEVSGLDSVIRQTVAVYQVEEGLIRRVWFY